MHLSANAMAVLNARYLLKNNKGEVIESPEQMFRRVAKAIAQQDEKYGANPKIAEKQFYDVMTSLEFLPNSPTLMNAGTRKQMLSACFSLPIEDSLESIFQSLKDMAIIEQVGGGVGFNFSALRPEGGIVGSTKGVASGPLSFMRIYDMATEVIKQGSRRRGAMMGILNVNHPDILKFIEAKKTLGILKNFNLSVAITDYFMKCVFAGKAFSLINPLTGKIERKINALNLFNKIVESAWATGDPGLIFIDEINRKHPLRSIGKIESTNPCGELPLLPYESCNLGSINLSKIVKNKAIDWEKLKMLVHTGVHFLDNVIDANDFPLDKIKKVTLSNRKIGLGVMGFADMLFQLEIPYDSEQALDVAESLISFIKKEAIAKSIELAMERGPFPNLKKSNLSKKYKMMRNATLLSIAPTGTISIIANTSSSIEPIFAISFYREILGGKKLLEFNQYFVKAAKESGIYSEELLSKIAQTGKLQDKDVPEKLKRIFVTATEIKPEWHIRMQAVFQKYVDNAVSKTINLPESATPEDVKSAFLIAYKLKCKGVTVYRYGSKKEQVLYFGIDKEKEGGMKVHSEFAGGCPTTECSF